MTDIVNRLRAIVGKVTLARGTLLMAGISNNDLSAMREAADEIERLRGINVGLTNDYNSLLIRESRAADEITRLRAGHDALHLKCSNQVAEIGELHKLLAANERDLEKALAALDHHLRVDR